MQTYVEKCLRQKFLGQVFHLVLILLTLKQAYVEKCFHFDSILQSVNGKKESKYVNHADSVKLFFSFSPSLSRSTYVCGKMF